VQVYTCLNVYRLLLLFIVFMIHVVILQGMTFCSTVCLDSTYSRMTIKLNCFDLYRKSVQCYVHLASTVFLGKGMTVGNGERIDIGHALLSASKSVNGLRRVLFNTYRKDIQ